MLPSIAFVGSSDVGPFVYMFMCDMFVCYVITLNFALAHPFVYFITFSSNSVQCPVVFGTVAVMCVLRRVCLLCNCVSFDCNITFGYLREIHQFILIKTL